MASFFATTIKADSRFNSLQRVSDMSLLEDTTRTAVENIIRDAAAMGITVVAFETYRSQPRQAALFAEGVTQLKTVGVHHYGLACDIVRVVGGEPTWKGDYTFLGHLAHAYGLIWGGDWGRPDLPHSFLDVVHVQRCSVARQSALFSGTWYPDATYNPYDDVRTPGAMIASAAPAAVPANAITPGSAGQSSSSPTPAQG
jgi:hypothetical protein